MLPYLSRACIRFLAHLSHSLSFFGLGRVGGGEELTVPFTEMLTSATCSRVLQPHHTSPTDCFPFDSAVANISSLFEARGREGGLFCVVINDDFFQLNVNTF